MLRKTLALAVFLTAAACSSHSKDSSPVTPNDAVPPPPETDDPTTDQTTTDEPAGPDVEDPRAKLEAFAAFGGTPGTIFHDGTVFCVPVPGSEGPALTFSFAVADSASFLVLRAEDDATTIVPIEKPDLISGDSDTVSLIFHPGERSLSGTAYDLLATDLSITYQDTGDGDTILTTPSYPYVAHFEVRGREEAEHPGETIVMRSLCTFGTKNQ